VELTVLLFAAARERVGLSRLTLPLASAQATVEDVLAELARRHPQLVPLLPHLRVAVDQEFVGRSARVRPGAELALIPPVAGGEGRFAVLERPLSLQDVVDAVLGEDAGGLVTFTGAVRNLTRGRRVLRLEYEAYGPMAERVMEAIGREAEGRWPGCRLAIHHRTGTLEPGAVAVVIAAAAAHRAEAFEACRHAIERLKQDVPIWKKELFEDGEVWVGLGP
jgi:MoaE-MoaD fusion protein